MKVRRVVFSERAESDLRSLEAYIAADSGRRVAERFVNRIIDYCLSFDIFSERGTRLEDGSRKIGYKRRVTIRFEVLDDRVEIVTVAYGGRSIE